MASLYWCYFAVACVKTPPSFPSLSTKVGYRSAQRRMPLFWMLADWHNRVVAAKGAKPLLGPEWSPLTNLAITATTLHGVNSLQQ